jgi:hypothetical protein
MSKGSPIITLRLPPALLTLVRSAIARSEHTRFEGPWDLSSFIVAAIREKLAHMERSNRPRRKAKQPPESAAMVRCEKCSVVFLWGDDGAYRVGADGGWLFTCPDCCVAAESVSQGASIASVDS